VTVKGGRPPDRWRAAATGGAVGVLLGLLTASLGLSSLVSFWGDSTPMVAVFAVLGAALWLTRFRSLLAILTCVLVLTWGAAAFTPLCPWLARGLTRRDTPGPADGVFVLGSRIQRDGDPTSAAEARLERATELLAQGLAKRLVVSEIAGNAPQHAELARRRLAALRLEADVYAVGPIRNTRDEAVCVARLSRERGWRRLLLVTSPAHSRRASAAFEHEGLLVISVPATETLYDMETLDRGDERLIAFGALIHERVGLLWYRWRGYL
jgi:uncharacterized SAM-binding protein YcdF (DUF218 family)